MIRYKEYIYYCPKCGDMWFREEEEKECLCAVCQHKMLETLHEYNMTLSRHEEIWKDGWKELEKRYVDEVISQSPEFDLDLYNRRDEIMKQKHQEWKEKQARGAAILAGTDKGNPYGVTCPYCNATNVKRLGALSRTISLGFFGLGSGKIGKQWHCTHCGSDF